MVAHTTYSVIDFFHVGSILRMAANNLPRSTNFSRASSLNFVAMYQRTLSW